MMMWMDRELEEHQVYDHFANVASATASGGMQQLPPAPHPNGGGPPNGTAGIYAHLQHQHHHNSSTPTTTNSMGMDSSLGGSSPPPMTIDLDHDGPLHQHSTLPAVDHRLPMDSHHMDDQVQDIYGVGPQQHLYHQPHQLLSPSAMPPPGGDQPQHLMVSPNSSCMGPCYGDQETSMMMQSPNGAESELLGNSSLGGHAHHQTVADGKMNSKSKAERKNYLQIYARQFGLNDRGCYVAVGFAALAFLLFIIVIAMGATWPGKLSVEWGFYAGVCMYLCPSFLGLLLRRLLEFDFKISVSNHFEKQCFQSNDKLRLINYINFAQN